MEKLSLSNGSPSPVFNSILEANKPPKEKSISKNVATLEVNGTKINSEIDKAYVLSDRFEKIFYDQNNP